MRNHHFFPVSTGLLSQRLPPKEKRAIEAHVAFLDLNARYTFNDAAREGSVWQHVAQIAQGAPPHVRPGAFQKH